MVFTTLKYTVFRGWLAGYLLYSLVRRGETLTCSLVVFFIELEGRAEKKELVLAKLKKKKTTGSHVGHFHSCLILEPIL